MWDGWRAGTTASYHNHIQQVAAKFESRTKFKLLFTSLNYSCIYGKWHLWGHRNENKRRNHTIRQKFTSIFLFIGAVNLLSDANARHLMGSRTKRALDKSKRPILTQLLLFFFLHFVQQRTQMSPFIFRRDCNYVRLAVIHQRSGKQVDALAICAIVHEQPVSDSGLQTGKLQFILIIH